MEPVAFRRQLVADLCKLLGNQLPVTRSIAPSIAPNATLLAESPAIDVLPVAAPPSSPGSAPSASSAATPVPPMAPRLRQTLELLLAGDSEKQIARKLSISPHTVHAYVKSLYRKFDVSSRGELLARWVKR